MARKRRNSKSGTADSLSKKQSKGRSLVRLSSSVPNKNPQSLRDRPFQAPAIMRRAQRGIKPSAAKQSIRTLLRLERGERVVADMLGDPSLSFTAATHKNDVDHRWVLKHLGWKFRKDTSGRIRANVRKTRHKTLYKPTDTPGVSVPVVTKKKRERLLLGQWMAALNAAGRNDWSKMMKFPKGQLVGGILLETDPTEVQAILRALAEEESPFEGLYRTIARRS